MIKRILIIILFICSFLFVNCVCFSKEEVIPVNYHIINNNQPEPKENKIELIDIDNLRKQYSNNDIVGVIKIESLGINTIIVKGEDNEYYLSHDINGNKSIFGTEFVDYRNNNDLAHERQINVYGHNSSNEDHYSNLEFSKLNKIADKSSFNNLSDIYFYLDNEVLIYKPLAVKVITKDYEYTRLVYRSDDILKNHLKNLTSDTLYCNDDCSIEEDEQIIVLQTCYYEPKGSYLLLIATK